MIRRQLISLVLTAVAVIFVSMVVFALPTDWMSSVEKDWTSSAAVQRLVNGGKVELTPKNDARGGCDGIKDGKWGFHTLEDENPWWQVDLGSVVELGRVVVYNRCDYGADRVANLQIQVSADGSAWNTVYKHDGTVFYGFPDGKPLSAALDGVKARFVRLTIPGKSFLHFDEIEVYGKSDPAKNLALGKPADQSSISPWSVARPEGGIFPVSEVVARGTRLAQDLESKGVQVGPLAAQLEGIAKRSAAVKSDDAVSAEKLYTQARAVVRKLVFSNPLLNFDSILFVKRQPGSYSHMSDQNYGWWSRPGGGVYVIQGFKTDSPKIRCLTESLPPGSVNSPDLSYDGKKVLFAYARYYEGLSGQEKLDKSKLPEDAFYHIYEVNIDGTGLKKLTKGKYDDFDPRHLPDGEILFLSTRRGQFLQCGEQSAMETMKADLPDSYVRCGGDQRRPVAIYTMHTMSPDGSRIRAISAFESFEWTPMVDADGKITYARWDYVDRPNGPYMKLWATNPDGTNPHIVYGNYTQNPHCTFDARRIPGSTKYVSTASAHHSITAGSLITIDPTKALDGLDAVTRLTPEVCFPETEGWPATYYCNPYPLSENYFLTAWSNVAPVREQGPNPPNALGLYVIDSFGNLEMIYRDAEISSMYPIPLIPRKREVVIPSKADWAGPQEGSFMLCDVYRGLTGIQQGTVKKLRIVAMPAKTQPWMNSPSLGVMNEDPGKCVLGTVPVEKDGSANFRVPSGVSVFFQALDAEGKSLQTMRTLTYVQPGQKQGCVGCHERRDTTPVGLSVMPAAFRREASKIVPGPDGSWPLRYDRLVQPVLDKSCVSCHSPAGKDSSAAAYNLTAQTSYDTLLNLGNPRLRDQINQAYGRGYSQPGDGGARNSSLMKTLQSPDGHHGVKLSKDDLDRLITWLDVYSQRTGSFSPEQEKNLEDLKDRWVKLLDK